VKVFENFCCTTTSLQPVIAILPTGLSTTAVITMPSNNSGRSLPFVYPLDRYDNETNETNEIYNDRLSPRFEVGSEALEVLKKISIPVAPLAIVGRYVQVNLFY